MLRSQHGSEYRMPDGYSYERTVMCGRFRDELREAAQDGFSTDNTEGGSKKNKVADSRPPAVGFREKRKVRIVKRFSKKCAKSLKFFGEDWFFLAALGILMAFCSFIMDFCIEKLQEIHHWLLVQAGHIHWSLQYIAWVSYTVVLVLVSTGFVHFVAPQAIGSGIPEMKTILRGVVLKEYLSFRTLVSKMVGLTVSLGSGLPIGKEGPFVHVASIVATLLSRLITSFKGIYENESRNSEMLAAACAVGVACTFGAPVGGVLFSIEVTSVYFAVRNYWRGFFAAACSATVFRLLAVWFKKEVTVVAFYKTSLPVDYPFYPEELFPFGLIGVACGFGGALFVYTHRSIVLFMRRNHFAKVIIQKNLLVYPAVVALLVSTIRFPLGSGKFSAGDLTFRQSITHLFSNFSWIQPNLKDEQLAIVKEWAPDGTNIFITLTLYTITIFFFGAISNTLPIPAGVFIPVFVIGAAFGRLTGEAMFAWFPEGIRGGPEMIVPGGYAVVGAAAFVGAVTHTVSVSVIVFELTGQLAYLLPVMIAVLISNAICAYLQPSIYDSMIRIKHLPYLPDIPPASSMVHNIHAERIMVRNVKYLSKDSTYQEAQDLFINMPRLRAFPLVDKPDSMILLGSIPRRKLEALLVDHVGEKARQAEAFKRRREQIGNSFVPRASLVPDVEDLPSAQSWRSRKDSSLVRLNIPTVVTEDVDQRKHSVDSTSATNGDDDQQHHYNPFLTVQNVYNTANSYMRSIVKAFTWGRTTTNANNIVDLTPEERIEWEKTRLKDKLDFTTLQIDPAPFQLVERTSLFKVHSLFSLLGMNRAYVTNCGRLVGVVALREVRAALERGAQSGFRRFSMSFDSQISVPDSTNQSIVESPLELEGTMDQVVSTQLEELESNTDVDITDSTDDDADVTVFTDVENGQL